VARTTRCHLHGKRAPSYGNDLESLALLPLRGDVLVRRASPLLRRAVRAEPVHAEAAACRYDREVVLADVPVRAIHRGGAVHTQQGSAFALQPASLETTGDAMAQTGRARDKQPHAPKPDTHVPGIVWAFLGASKGAGWRGVSVAAQPQTRVSRAAAHQVAGGGAQAAALLSGTATDGPPPASSATHVVFTSRRLAWCGRGLHVLHLLVSLLIQAGSPDGGSVQLIIWAGERTPDAGESRLSRFKEESAQWDSLVSLAEGFPRLVHSDDVPGLRPGWYVVLLGACDAVRATRVVSALKSRYPDVYSRPGRWPDADLQCPQVVDLTPTEAVERFLDGYGAKDASRMRAFISKDGLYFEEGAQTLQGKNVVSKGALEAQAVSPVAVDFLRFVFKRAAGLDGKPVLLLDVPVSCPHAAGNPSTLHCTAGSDVDFTVAREQAGWRIREVRHFYFDSGD
jgi:hypothetical protein